MTDELIVTRFHPNDPIPPWLIDMEPVGPHSVRGQLIFGGECDVIDVGPYFVLVPLGFGAIDLPIKSPGCVGVKIFATQKMLRVGLNLATIETVDSPHWHETREDTPLISVQQPPQQPSAQSPAPAYPHSSLQLGWQEAERQRQAAMSPAPPPEAPGFWERVRRVFRP